MQRNVGRCGEHYVVADALGRDGRHGPARLRHHRLPMHNPERSTLSGAVTLHECYLNVPQICTREILHPTPAHDHEGPDPMEQEVSFCLLLSPSISFCLLLSPSVSFLVPTHNTRPFDGSPVPPLHSSHSRSAFLAPVSLFWLPSHICGSL
jgi:hypothetical protein